MIRSLLCLVAASLFIIQPALAGEATDSTFADYTILAGGSPFGGSFTFAVNQSRKTSYNFSFGLSPNISRFVNIVNGITSFISISIFLAKEITP